MLNLNNVIELKTNDLTTKLVFATRYLVQINFTFDLTVKSSSFEGTSHFCVRKEQVEEFVDGLEKTTQGDSARLDDNDSDGFIEVSFKDSLGHLKVTAQVGGTHENHVKTSFEADQTALPEFIEGFKKLLTYEDDEDPSVVGHHTGRH